VGEQRQAQPLGGRLEAASAACCTMPTLKATEATAAAIEPSVTTPA
jgi:hypothetical protein